MKKTFRRIGSACVLATLYFGSSSAHAFCTEFDVLGVGANCVDEGHKRVTSYIKPILRHEIWSSIWNGNYAQDNPFGDFANIGQRHFESCRFATDGDIPGSADYIRETYRVAINNLDPVNPHPFRAADNFGKLLHTVQDFYSHTNWINLLNLSAPTPVNSTHLLDRTVGEWRLLSPLSRVQDNIIVGQIPASGLGGWSVSQELTSETPVFMTNEGDRRGLITGWNENGACPDVREGMTIDDRSHIAIIPGTVRTYSIPRTLRLTHGESKIAGLYDLPGAYQADRPCHNGYPTYMCLQKDHPGRPDYDQAIHLAQYQTAQEWCRLLHLAKDSQFGYSAASILMTLWAKPHNEPSGPHPITTACGTPPQVLAGKPGPIELQVTPAAATISRGVVSPNSGRNLVFALYTGDFRRSLYSVPDRLAQVAGPVQAADLPAPITMCVNPGDTVVSTIWGWDDIDIGLLFNPREFDQLEPLLRGVSTVLAGPGFAPGTHSTSSADMAVDFAVRVNPTDVDADGLAICAEQFYGTNPLVADTDNDGLSDGAEVNTHHTDPLDADTDNDGLNDGPEVNTYGTNPLDTDTDDDGLTDGAEVNTYGTDPNDADTDNDGLPDGIEVKYGTNPLLRDSDGDGLPDGQDVEWIEGVIASISNAAIKSSAAAHRNAMLSLLNNAEALLLKGNRRAALEQLRTLRMRIDGCGIVSDSDDWIIDCAIQTEIRMLVDLLIANVSA